MQTVKVYAIQTALHWQDPEANRRHFADLIQRCGDADLIVLPEMFTTGFSMASAAIAETAPGPTITWMQQQARKLDAAVTGSVAVADGEHYYNRLYWVTPDGGVDWYDKRHLFRMAGEHEHYTAGNVRRVVAWRGLRFCLQVCYDLRFPVFARNRDDYDALIYVANWPAQRAHAWRTLLPARAVENQAYVIGVNRVGEDGNGYPYSGDSAIFDYLGQPLAAAGDDEQILQAELHAGNLHTLRERFPARLDADGFSLRLP